MRSITPDPTHGVRGQVLQLNANADALFPLDSNDSSPLGSVRPLKNPSTATARARHTLIALPPGPASLIAANYCHSFWSQEYLLLINGSRYHVRAGSYPYETFAAVKLAVTLSRRAAIHCDSGQTLIKAAVLTA